MTAKTSNSVPTIFVVASLLIRVSELWPILQRKKPGRASIGCPSGWRVTFRIPSLACRARVTDKRGNVLADREKHLYIVSDIKSPNLEIYKWLDFLWYIYTIRILIVSRGVSIFELSYLYLWQYTYLRNVLLMLYN